MPIRKQKLAASTAAQLKDLKWAVLGFSLISVLLVAWRRSSAMGHEDPMGVRLAHQDTKRTCMAMADEFEPPAGLLGLSLLGHLPRWYSVRLPPLDGDVELQRARHCRYCSLPSNQEMLGTAIPDLLSGFVVQV